PLRDLRYLSHRGRQRRGVPRGAERRGAGAAGPPRWAEQRTLGLSGAGPPRGRLHPHPPRLALRAPRRRDGRGLGPPSPFAAPRPRAVAGSRCSGSEPQRDVAVGTIRRVRAPWGTARRTATLEASDFRQVRGPHHARGGAELADDQRYLGGRLREAVSTQGRAQGGLDEIEGRRDPARENERVEIEHVLDRGQPATEGLAHHLERLRA